MAVFLERDMFNCPSGKQMVVSSSVIDEKDIKDKKIITVLLHTRRLEKNTEKETYDWRDRMITAEVPIETGKEIKVGGMPIMKTVEMPKGKTVNICNKMPNSELDAFVKQFLGLYYKGEKISNFVLSEKIRPLEGWSVDFVDQILVSEDGRTVYAKIDVSTEGAVKVKQELFIKIKSKDGRYFVEEISPAF